MDKGFVSNYAELRKHKTGIKASFFQMCREKGLDKKIVHAIVLSMLGDIERVWKLKEDKKAMIICLPTMKEGYSEIKCGDCGKKVYHSQNVKINDLVKPVCGDCAINNHEHRLNDAAKEMIERMKRGS